MGSMKEKRQIPLSVFYLKYFLYIFVSAFVLAACVFFGFGYLVNAGVIYPANHGEKQAQNAFSRIQTAGQITPDMIPSLCDYIIFDPDGNRKGGNLTGADGEAALTSLREGRRTIGKYSYMAIPRDGETCVLRYTLSPRYSSPLLQKLLLSPQLLIFGSAMLGMLLIIVLVAMAFGKALNRRLAALTLVTGKIRQQELDFEISPSGIREVDAVLHSMDQMRIALKDALERQWQLEEEKNRQMSALAHDLKTPLTLVRGNGDLLLESSLSEDQRKYTWYIVSSALQMQNYVQALIEVTRSWQGNLFRPQEVLCDSLFRELREQLNGLCAIHHLTPVWDCRFQRPKIYVDHDLFLRAMVNVLSNAAERTPSGGSITLSLFDGDGCFAVTVTDTGSGFSPAALKHGTEQFYMDDTSRTSKTHYGIGLYAAASILKKHGGQLVLANDSETGGGQVTLKVPSGT